MIKNTIQLMNESETIAKNLAPIDTGNLRYNALRAYKTPTGFRIVVLFTVASYGLILNEGKGKHSGWWSTGVLTAVTTYVDASLNERKNLFNEASPNVAKFAQDNPKRRARFYNSMVADSGRDKFIAGV